MGKYAQSRCDHQEKLRVMVNSASIESEYVPFIWALLKEVGVKLKLKHFKELFFAYKTLFLVSV